QVLAPGTGGTYDQVFLGAPTAVQGRGGDPGLLGHGSGGQTAVAVALQDSEGGLHQCAVACGVARPPPGGGGFGLREVLGGHAEILCGLSLGVGNETLSFTI